MKWLCFMMESSGEERVLMELAAARSRPGGIRCHVHAEEKGQKGFLALFFLCVQMKAEPTL